MANNPNPPEFVPSGGGLIDYDPNKPSPYAWDPLPGETPEEFYFFRKYRDLGPGRTLEDLALLVGQEVDLVRGLAERHSWSVRSDQFQVYLTSVLSNHTTDRIKAGDIENEEITNDLLSTELQEIALAQAKEKVPGAPQPTIKDRYSRLKTLSGVKDKIKVKRDAETAKPTRTNVMIFGDYSETEALTAAQKLLKNEADEAEMAE